MDVIIADDENIFRRLITPGDPDGRSDRSFLRETNGTRRSRTGERGVSPVSAGRKTGDLEMAARYRSRGKNKRNEKYPLAAREDIRGRRLSSGISSGGLSLLRVAGAVIFEGTDGGRRMTYGDTGGEAGATFSQLDSFKSGSTRVPSLSEASRGDDCTSLWYWRIS